MTIMILRCLPALLALTFLYTPVGAVASYPELTSVDGRKTIRALPLALEGEKIRFAQAGGKTFVAGLGKFSAKDQKNLRDWMDAMARCSHPALIQRVRQAEVLRVLFVGNSYSFQIPKVFENLARAEGRKIEVGQVTKGGWTLAKHAAAQATLDRIAQGRWDVVVLQEQSQIPAFADGQRSRQMDAAAKKLADAAREAKAIPVFFLTWGRRDGDLQNAKAFPNDSYAAMQKRLVAGYQKAASQAGGAHVVPVGEVWSVLRRAKQDDGLYAKDGSHPAKRGNYLGACVFYTAFYNETVGKRADEVEGSDEIRRTAAMAGLVTLPYPLRSNR